MGIILMESETQIGKHRKLICSRIKYLLLNSTFYRPVCNSYLKLLDFKELWLHLRSSDFSTTPPFHSLSTYFSTKIPSMPFNNSMKCTLKMDAFYFV